MNIKVICQAQLLYFEIYDQNSGVLMIVLEIVDQKHQSGFKDILVFLNRGLNICQRVESLKRDSSWYLGEVLGAILGQESAFGHMARIVLSPISLGLSFEFFHFFCSQVLCLADFQALQYIKTLSQSLIHA